MVVVGGVVGVDGGGRFVFFVRFFLIKMSEFPFFGKPPLSSFLFIWKLILNKCECKPLSEGLVEGVDKTKGDKKLRGILRETP